MLAKFERAPIIETLELLNEPSKLKKKKGGEQRMVGICSPLNY